MKKVRRSKKSKIGFIRRMEKQALAGLLGVSIMMLTTGFTDKSAQNVTVEVDGRIVETRTANFSPENIFNTIGVNLKEHDEYIVIKNDNDVKIRVLRSLPVSVQIEDAGATYYNTTITGAYDFLKANGYDMDKYEANIPLNANITENMQIILTDKEAKAARIKAEEEAAREAEKVRQVETYRGQEEYVDALTMEASAYLPGDGNGDGVTALGIPATYGVAAVDPRVIPLGTRLYVEGYGEAIAADTGGAIRGSKIDLCMEDYSEAMSFGRRDVTVYILR